jgi:hypothetical protein
MLDLEKENTESVVFRYSNHLIFICLWIVFSVVFSSIFFIPQLSQFCEYLIAAFNGIGFIIYVFIAIILFTIVFIGSYILSIYVTDKNGTAIFYVNYFEIEFDKKTIKINYNEIEKMQFYAVPKTVKTNGKLTNYRFNLKTLDNIRLDFTSSYKEIWENYGVKDKSTLEALYDKIELHIALKYE